MKRNDLQDRLKLKRKIIKIFNKKVRRKSSNTKRSNANHDGKEGHWLEKQMGLSHNGKNEPDMFGFEMKNGTKGKTTFGDWSASNYLFKSKKNPTSTITKDDFLKIFGKPNPAKGNRYSWSGEPCPKIKNYNSFGQKLQIDKNGSILVIYNYSKDSRPKKSKIVPKQFQINKLILAKWDSEWMKKKVESKFNKNGWFKCIRNKSGVYSQIGFGDPINYKIWLSYVKTGDIFFDSGMCQGNSRNYSHWRASNKIWDRLIKNVY